MDVTGSGSDPYRVKKGSPLKKNTGSDTKKNLIIIKFDTYFFIMASRTVLKKTLMLMRFCIWMFRLKPNPTFWKNCIQIRPIDLDTSESKSLEADLVLIPRSKISLNFPIRNYRPNLAMILFKKPDQDLIKTPGFATLDLTRFSLSLRVFPFSRKFGKFI